ncbi:hypothetical protein AEST_02250 [Alishewanella aestuarii B11]|uniref:Uncharacterized protein n=1 Tax=Alishewanella aestuarii B11 TaxID=1197174 RepID=J2IIP9_9ALTE|nr:hypothetical protein AEST_02250 [Alishewanella aestuarii B11]
MPLFKAVKKSKSMKKASTFRGHYRKLIRRTIKASELTTKAPVRFANTVQPTT